MKIPFLTPFLFLMLSLTVLTMGPLLALAGAATRNDGPSGSLSHSRGMRAKSDCKGSARQCKVFKILSEQLGVDKSQISLSKTLEALGADSLAIVEIVIALEKEFECDIPDKDCAMLKTVRDFDDYIHNNCHA